MKTLLVLASLLSVTFAGVGRLSSAEEDEVLNVYRRACGRGGSSSEPVEVNGRWIFCKEGPQLPPKTTTIVKPITFQPPKPISVFINRPPQTVVHQVTVTGEHPGQDTKIYVLPQQQESQVDVQSDVKSNKQKPVVFFIKDKNVGQEEYAASAPLPVVAPADEGYAPQEGYLPGQYQLQQ
ncbi:unnamed protein product [Orchesella dallaii]|uniref:DUF243 domain-containing protein n=1 Tax=Orchesella dallaii TaxID=48710 RepID=A0ABP1QCX1_9HEXA